MPFFTLSCTLVQYWRQLASGVVTGILTWPAERTIAAPSHVASEWRRLALYLLVLSQCHFLCRRWLHHSTVYQVCFISNLKKDNINKTVSIACICSSVRSVTNYAEWQQLNLIYSNCSSSEIETLCGSFRPPLPLTLSTCTTSIIPEAVSCMLLY